MSDAPSIGADPKHAWRDVARAAQHKRSATERLADYLEIHGPYDEATAREQASRCVQCPEPACVTSCPLSNRIPEWLALTAEGHFLEAAAILHSTSSLPEICARVCPADRMCEGMCILNGKAEPVSVWSIEQFLNEYAFAHGGAQGAVAAPNGRRVAVVGAGPGGLTCADVLSRQGYAITVFDWRLVPGGLLVSGTPSFRVNRSVVKRRIEMLEKRGVTFRMGVALGESHAYHALRDEFDAVYLGFGARKARELNVPGSHLDGVVPALSFLLQADAEPPSDALPRQVAGRRVIVLGGGDMALDCLRTAIRAGAREPLCVYRRDEADLPCIRSEYQNAVEEGARFQFLAAPVAVVGNEAGAVSAVRFVRTRMIEAAGEGRRTVDVLPGTEFEVAADWVIPALGFEAVPLPESNPFGSLARREDGTLRVDEHQMTSIPGVFAGGDLVRGPSKVLDVVRDARRAACGIQNHIQSRPPPDAHDRHPNPAAVRSSRAISGV